ncbi:hypothetical protein C6496_12735 [Candidatus Poribacteria bacterium]|nr:MAG: hypothetical protein C6496_12735 [Candidatus Poribacteria bacterium]
MNAAWHSPGVRGLIRTFSIDILPLWGGERKYLKNLFSLSKFIATCVNDNITPFLNRDIALPVFYEMWCNTTQTNSFLCPLMAACVNLMVWNTIKNLIFSQDFKVK